MFVYTLAYIIGPTLLLFFFYQLLGTPGRGRKQFPGPTPAPLVGHLFQIPTVKHWVYFDKLLRQYGPIVKLTLAGDDIIVLGSSADAEELLGRRSQNYSSRRPLIFAGKYQSNNKRALLLPYGETVRKQRTAFLSMVHPRVVNGYQPVQELESLKLLYDLLSQPGSSGRHCRRFAASLVFHLSYGKRLSDDDGNLDAVITTANNFVAETYPGTHLVDTFPSLDYLPDFLASWRVEARRKHEIELKLYSRLALAVKKEIDDGNVDLECFAARLWDQQKELDFQTEDIAYLTGTAFEAGMETTAGTICWFLMAVLLHPEIVKRAHEELDNILGDDGKTIPTFAHYDNLPYCIAICKEVLRWRPIAPGGFPHYSDKDDDYKGFKIKGKTIIIPNMWSMHRDEEAYSDASQFKPERYLSEGSITDKDITKGHYTFGFGHRMCPGRHLSVNSLWIAITRMLWAFDFFLEQDEDGVPIPVSPDNCTSGMTSRPHDFPIQIKARSVEHVNTIKRELESLGVK